MKKKVLIVSLTPCYPVNHGGALGQYFFIEGLKEKVQFVFCTEIYNEEGLKDIKLLKEKQPNLTIYYVDKTEQPVHKNLKNYLKTTINYFIKFFFTKKKDQNVLVVSADDFEDSYFWHVDHCYSKEYVSLVNDVIIKEDIKQIQFDYYETIDLCFAIPENVRKIYINHEVRYRRLELASENSLLPDSYKNHLIRKTEMFERNCIKKMDEVVFVNEFDATLFESDALKVSFSPPGIPDELICKEHVSKSFSKFIFLGSEGHTPNKLGLMWFLDSIYLPNLKDISYPVYITGNWSKEFKDRYCNCSQIIFLGMVDSLIPYYDNSILINPILTGAGVRTKILQSFANKIPVLSTPFGAEGCFNDSNRSHLSLFSDAKGFLCILKSANFIDLGLAGYNYFIEKYDKKILLNKRFEIYN